MKKHLKAFSDTVNTRQILIGLVMLLLGSLVYLVDCPPDQTYFISNFGINISLYNLLPNLFGIIGNSLLDFVHPFSFILIRAVLVACRKRDYLIICLIWFFVDCVFEFGQKFNSWSSTIIPDWFAGIPFLENTENYFVHGTFDSFDLAAITIDTVLSYFVLLTTIERGK